MPDPIRVVVDHPAPMAIRWGRGNGLGLFAVRTRTPVEIQGVDPRDLAIPASVPSYVDPTVRVHGRRLWIPVDAIGHGGMGRARATLDEALSHLTDPPKRGRNAYEGGVIGLDHPPFKTPYGWDLHNARAIQDGGEVPRSAMDAVEAARQAASLALTAHVGSHLLHDGTQLYARMRLPLINPADLGKPTTALLSGLHRPCFLHTRLGPRGEIPFGSHNESIPHMVDWVGPLNDFLEGIDVGDEDIDRFLVSAPAALVGQLRGMRDPGVEPLLERLFPLLVAGARGERHEAGFEAAAEAVRAAASAILDSDRRTLGANFGLIYKTAALESYVGFVDKVIRPSLADPAHADDEDAIGVLAP